MLARGFERVFPGARGGELAREALACDTRAFVGYARWEINDRWDVCAARRGVARYEDERRLLQPPGRTPARPSRAVPSEHPIPALPCRARRLRARAAAAMIFALRRKLAKGRPRRPARSSAAWPAARPRRPVRRDRQGGPWRRADLWRLTRDRRVRGPNERMVARDPVRLRALRRWIARCAADPARLATASPVCGAWQLRFDVLLTEPALQRMVVECREPEDRGGSSMGARRSSSGRKPPARGSPSAAR